MKTIISSTVIVFCFVAFIGVAQGAQRKVLAELQASTTCSPCYAADVYYFQNWLPGYTNAQRVITIAHHVWWPSPGNDPMYLANSAAIQTRVNYYSGGGSTYAPRMYVDGFIDGGSGYAGWPGMIDSRLQTASPISIELTGSRAGDTLSLTARVYAEAVVNSSNWRVHWVLLQDSVSAPQNSPGGYIPLIHDAVNRAMYPDANGSPISISQGQTVEIQKSIALSSSWIPNKCRVVVFIQDNTDKQIMNAEVVKVSDLGSSGLVAYFEDFTDSSAGWRKVAGPGFLAVSNGVFAHTPPGVSVWCEYVYTGRTFGNAAYEADVFVDSAAVSTSFVWRAPDTTQVTGSGGAYQARFNNSPIAPGGIHHFILEKFDPTGRTILLDLPNQFLGLNHLEIIDSGTVLQVKINGITHGNINVESLTPPQPGYVFLVGGDWGNADYFDNVGVRSILALTSPNGGEEWATGSTHNITWTSAFVNSVKIELSTNDGTSWSTIVSSTPAASGSYSWLLPSLPVNQCRIRISDVGNPLVADTSDNSFTITGLVAYYPFNGNANDESGNGNNGSIYGCTYGNGVIGSCLDLTTGNHADVPNSSLLNPTRVTLALWVKLDTLVMGGNQFLVSKGDDGTQGSYYITQNGSQQFHFYLGANGIDQVYVASQTLNLTTYRWYHVSGTYDGTTLKVYVDGQLSGSSSAQRVIGNTDSLHIGYQDIAGWEYFLDGRLDDVRLYNRALSDSEIDSLYHEARYLTNQYPVLSSWNMLSVPLTVADARKATLFSTATSNAFAYTPSGYVVRDTLQNGTGYWLKFDSAQVAGISGTLRMRDTIAVSAGWNMIGTISDSVRTSTIQQIPPTIIASQIYGYNAGYSVTTMLLPSRGYWVKTIASGLLILSSASGLSKGGLSPSYALDRAATITISDSRVATQTLCFTSELMEKKDLDFFELPPSPPEGVFHTRFSTNRMLEAVKEGESRTVPIHISYAQYPLTISWDMKDQSLTASLMIGTTEVPMGGNGFVTVSDSKAPISLKLGGYSSLPKEFALFQNYPNPFNPSTTIKYDLPKDSRVSLKLFNILGQEVATLVNEEQKAGYRSVQWNANNVASGVYFYRIQAGEFVSTKRLLLLK